MNSINNTEIIIISKDRKQAEFTSVGLKVHGHKVSACLCDIDLAEDLCRSQSPLAVVVDEEVLINATARATSALGSSAVILLADPGQAEEALNRARIPVDALLLRPIDTRHLAISIDLAVKNRLRLAGLAQDSAQMHAELSERKIVEKAKGLLMNQMEWDPIQAEDYLQQQAQGSGISLGQAAQIFIDNPVRATKAG